MKKSKLTEAELKEKLKQVGQDILTFSADKKLSFDDALFEAEWSLLMVNPEENKTGFTHIESHLYHVIETLDEAHSGKPQTAYLSTGLLELDEMLCGLEAGNLYVVGGSPGMGKTSLLLTILHHVSVQQKVPAGIISMDLTSIQITFRLLCLGAKVDTHLVRTGNVSKSLWKIFMSNVEMMAKTPIFIDDTVSISPLQMKHKAIRLKAEHDIKLLIIDHHQVIQKQNTQNHTYHLLKRMAEELDIPIIVTSPLTQNPEKRKNRRPVLGDLQNALEIEESADIIMFIYRPWVDTLDEDDKELAELIIAKNRNGPTGVVNMRFIDKYATFYSDTAVDRT